MKHVFLFLSIASAITAVVLFSMTNLQADEADIEAPSIESEKEHPFAEKCYKCHATEPAHQEWLHSGHSKALVNLRHG
ncbi:MAG: hypothetical protein O7D34_11825, partial [Ignavibacteria bacterium]|nr:hypothetical protein [Ignavibacteria bacterium]